MVQRQSRNVIEFVRLYIIYLTIYVTEIELGNSNYIIAQRNKKKHELPVFQ